MPAEVTFGDRIAALEKEYDTQREFAESMGVSARTIRRWKNSELEAPVTQSSRAGRKLKDKLESRFRGLDYQKLRRREYWHYREVQERLQREAVRGSAVTEVPSMEPQPLIEGAPVDPGVLRGPPVAFVQSRSDLPEARVGDMKEGSVSEPLKVQVQKGKQPEIADAIERGDTVVFTVLIQDRGQTPGQAVEADQLNTVEIASPGNSRAFWLKVWDWLGAELAEDSDRSFLAFGATVV